MDIPGTHLHSAMQLLSGFIVVLLFTRDVKDGVHQTKGWSNSGKDNNNDIDKNEFFINYCILLHFAALPVAYFSDVLGHSRSLSGGKRRGLRTTSDV